MKKFRQSIAVFLTMALLLTAFLTVPVMAEDRTTEVDRIFGENRCQTAVAVSEDAYPEGADTVIIVTANNFPDALAGSVLAHKLGAPILLVRDNVTDMALVLAEIERLGATKAYVLGGDKAVAEELEALVKTKVPTERIAGESRYETAQRVAEMVGMPNDGHVFLVSGSDFPDALAIAPVAARLGVPILLTRPDYLREDVLDALEALNIKSVTLIGGPKAISEELEALLEDEDIEVEERVFGDSREDTAVAIATKYFGDIADVLIANGRTGYPDALVAGYLGALRGIPLLLVEVNKVRESTASYLEDNEIETITILGGDKVVSEDVEEELAESKEEEEPGEPVVPTDPDAAAKQAAKAAIKPSWAVKNVEVVENTEGTPVADEDANSSYYKVSIATSYADLESTKASGRSVTTYFTVPEDVTVWYPVVKEDDLSKLEWESTGGVSGTYTLGLEGHALNTSNIEQDGVVFVAISSEEPATEFSFTVKLVDASWANIVYGNKELTISTDIPGALDAINGMTGKIVGIIDREITPLKNNAQVLGLDLTDFDRVFAGDEASQEGGRQSAIIRDLVANKPAGGYDLLSLKEAFDSIVMVRLANQDVMDSANEDEATIEVLLGYVTILKDAFSGASHEKHGMTGTTTAGKATEMKELLEDFEALTSDQQNTVFESLLDGDTSEGRRFKRATDVIKGLRSAIERSRGR